jgi:hypothetical protein
VAEARVIWHAHHPEHSGLAGPSAWYASLSLGFGPGGRGARPGTRKKPASALAARHDPACHWHWPLSGRHGGRSRAAAGHRHGEVGMRTWHSSRTLPVLAFVRARTALPGRAASTRLGRSLGRCQLPASVPVRARLPPHHGPSCAESAMGHEGAAPGATRPFKLEMGICSRLVVICQVNGPALGIVPLCPFKFGTGLSWRRSFRSTTLSLLNAAGLLVA